jgi:ribosome maturation factor RimP
MPYVTTLSILFRDVPSGIVKRGVCQKVERVTEELVGEEGAFRGRNAVGVGIRTVISKSRLWNLIEPLIAQEGLELFDVDLPGAASGVLRIYVSRSKSGDSSGEAGSPSVGVNLDDCARVSRVLSRSEEFESMLPEKTTLEVSSPGVNRKLRRDEHFSGAIGEHVRLKVHGKKNSLMVLKGVLKEFESGMLRVQEDGSEELRDVALSDVSSARVDFVFDK